MAGRLKVGDTQEIEYDLATLAENLATAVPEISELYLFGSRARGTKSPRSDADVLVVADGHIKPQQLREFSCDNCEALDLFIVDEGKAISSQNESFIQTENFSTLLTVLGAVKIWSRNEGRAKANIEWRFKVRRDVAFIATALPSIAVPPTQRSRPPDPSKLTLKEILGGLTAPQLWALGVAIVSILLAVGSAGYWLGQQNLNMDTPAPPSKVSTT